MTDKELQNLNNQGVVFFPVDNNIFQTPIIPVSNSSETQNTLFSQTQGCKKERIQLKIQDTLGLVQTQRGSFEIQTFQPNFSNVQLNGPHIIKGQNFNENAIGDNDILELPLDSSAEKVKRYDLYGEKIVKGGRKHKIKFRDQALPQQGLVDITYYARQRQQLQQEEEYDCCCCLF